MSDYKLEIAAKHLSWRFLGGMALAAVVFWGLAYLTLGAVYVWVTESMRWWT